LILWKCYCIKWYIPLTSLGNRKRTTFTSWKCGQHKFILPLNLFSTRSSTWICSSASQKRRLIKKKVVQLSPSVQYCELFRRLILYTNLIYRSSRVHVFMLFSWGRFRFNDQFMPRSEKSQRTDSEKSQTTDSELVLRFKQQMGSNINNVVLVQKLQSLLSSQYHSFS